MNYYIICRSLTYAQRIARVLERSGISGFVTRAPRSISKEGCGYCVKVSEKKLIAALKALRRENLEFKRIYMQTQGGEYREVPNDLS